VNERSDVNPGRDASYSPRVRTALVLCGAGTAGAYQAGVLRALTEAGVKLDVVAGHGPGAGNALCAAIDGSARLWDADGPWMSAGLHGAYRWRGALRVFFIGLIATAILLVSPLLVLVAAAVTYAIGLALALINLTDASATVVSVYQRMIELLFNPPVLPTILPRAMLLTLLVVVSVLVVSAVRAATEERSRRRFAGGVWWRLLGAPLGADEPGHSLSQALWTLVRAPHRRPFPRARMWDGGTSRY
jgi:hypothetical protein